MNHPSQDPLGYDIPLPLCGRYFPLGFPLIIETNSREVLALAVSLWSRWPSSESGRAATFRIAVQGAGSGFPLAPAVFKGQGHLVSAIQSPDNFAVADLSASFAYAWLTEEVACDAEHLRYHVLEPLACLMIDAAFLAPLHASCVALHGNAVVLCGDSGAGKTSLAYTCARKGWTYLSDDATHVIRGADVAWVTGRPFRIRFRENARTLFPELREFEPRLRGNGKLDIEVETQHLNLRVAPRSRASHLVFLDRRTDSAAARFEPFPPEEAARHLHSQICYGDARIRAEQRQALDAMLQLPVLGLTYSDLDSAEVALRTLAASTEHFGGSS